MAAGDLTLTNHGAENASAAALKTLVDSINLASATDFLYLIPVHGGDGQVQVVSVSREA